MTWKFLRHPNVLPLLGVTITETRFAMVSEWMANGSINEFAKAHPAADRLTLVCLIQNTIHPCHFATNSSTAIVDGRYR